MLQAGAFFFLGGFMQENHTTTLNHQGVVFCPRQLTFCGLYPEASMRYHVDVRPSYILSGFFNKSQEIY